MNTKRVMLTTIDNPYNPFENFTDWFMFDIEKGYNTCQKLARFATISDQLSDYEIFLEDERVIDEFIEVDPLQIYTKVYSEE